MTSRSRETAPRRLRAADVIEAQQETIRHLTERHTAGPPQVAVDLSRSARGVTQISVKVTANMAADPAEVRKHAEEVLAVARAAYDAASTAYPYSE